MQGEANLNVFVTPATSTLPLASHETLDLGRCKKIQEDLLDISLDCLLDSLRNSYSLRRFVKIVPGSWRLLGRIFPSLPAIQYGFIGFLFPVSGLDFQALDLSIPLGQQQVLFGQHVFQNFYFSIGFVKLVLCLCK